MNTDELYGTLDSIINRCEQAKYFILFKDTSPELFTTIHTTLKDIYEDAKKIISYCIEDGDE